MRIVLVHDYLKEYGGAERVLTVLHEMFPEAPIYTLFAISESPCGKEFKNAKIVQSWFSFVPFCDKLISPFRFLIPLMWAQFNFKDFDLVISSASWAITKGFSNGTQRPAQGAGRPAEICYCHTPPRYLYGYPTSVNWQKYWPVRMFALIINHFMRVYDFEAAQRVDWFIANSQNVRKRIEKFYRRDSIVIYPPAALDAQHLRAGPPVDLPKVPKVEKGDYFLVVSRIVGAKGLQLAMEAANKLNIKLKVVGKPAGYSNEYQKIKNMAGDNIEFLGFVSDSELAKLYAGARAFLALATDEDFGMTPVEAMLCGTPVIAYRGGGYLETVVDGKTGVFFSPATVESLTGAIKNFEVLEKKGAFNTANIKKHAQKFSKERFKKEILRFVESKVK
ncbi:MAG: glycosyltransferase [Candidatus Curtissbacteria bacterium]|nr:glycosyltransferase [Candidatus Curtissbacteria bacterium]